MTRSTTPASTGSSHAKWSVDDLFKVLFELLLPYLPKEITVAVDDTLNKRNGPQIFGAGMHYDSMKSSYGRGSPGGGKAFFAFGHNWVILTVWVRYPWRKRKGVALPILLRLYRSRKSCPPGLYRKRTELAQEMFELLATWLPENRRLHLIGDAEYACNVLVLGLSDSVKFTGPMTMDAALYRKAKPYSGKGRPRKKGTRLPSPKALAADAAVPWNRLELTIYGREVTLLTKSQICLWYTVAGTRLVRMVVTRDPKSRIDDRAYFTTDDKVTIEQVLMKYSQRWEIEVTFRNAKQSMGLQDPQNGWWRRKRENRRPRNRPGANPRGRRGEKAVSHTIALAFVAYALVHLWYFSHGDRKADIARVRKQAPWYQLKADVSFADMLAAARREFWIGRLSRHPVLRVVRKKVGDLIPQWLLSA